MSRRPVRLSILSGIGSWVRWLAGDLVPVLAARSSTAVAVRVAVGGNLLEQVVSDEPNHGPVVRGTAARLKDHQIQAIYMYIRPCIKVLQ